MRFQCAVTDSPCGTKTGQPYTVHAVDVDEGMRCIRQHWALEHDIEGETPMVIDIVARVGF